MPSTGISSVYGSLYGNVKKKKKQCPSEQLAETIDRGIVREILERNEGGCEDITEINTTVDEPRCEEEEVYSPTTPPAESRTLRMKKAPRKIGRSIYDEPCGGSGNARATLEDWDVHGIRLAGRIYDDRRGQYPDGKMIYTDTIKADVSELKEGAIIRTRGNYYLLGKRHIPNDE